MIPYFLCDIEVAAAKLQHLFRHKAVFHNVGWIESRRFNGAVSGSGVTGGLSQGGQSLAEGGPPVTTVGGPLANIQKKFKKW